MAGTGKWLLWPASGAAGLATAWVFAKAVLLLLPSPPTQAPSPSAPIPLTLAQAPREEEPPPERKIRPRRRTLPARKAPERAPTSPPAKTPSPPLPSLPRLEWAPPSPGAPALPLPEFRACEAGPPAGGGGGGKGEVQEASFRKEEPFHWIYAPELEDREAMQRAWPKRALLRGLGGKVVLEVTVGGDLRVHSARVVSAAPAGVFENAAIRMVRRWRGSRPGVFLQPIRFVPPETTSW